MGRLLKYLKVKNNRKTIKLINYFHSNVLCSDNSIVTENQILFCQVQCEIDLET